MDDLYDEFGNFIGEAVSDDDGDEGGDEGVEAAAAQRYVYDEESDDDDDDARQPAADEAAMDVDEAASNAVILHEDKQYYPTAAQVYGDDVETMVQDEDAQPLTQPIIAPVAQKRFQVQEADLPPVHYSREFMSDLLSFPESIRNIAIAGHLHHGKTAFVDMLVMQTHDLQQRLDQRQGRKRDDQLRYTDTHYLERERGLSIKSAPMSLLMQASRGKSHLLHVIDTPGHVNFVDEVACSMRLVDGVVLVVDVVEGVQVTAEQVIKHAVLEDLPLVLVINKMDRLILELKLPPVDAYFKLKHVVEEVNTVIENTVPGRGERLRVSPEKGNVAFASAEMGWVFTLPSFAAKYAQAYAKVDAAQFAQRLWGDVFFNAQSRKFTRRPAEEGARRAFVTFVLEPIYKLYAQTISQSPDELEGTLEQLGIRLRPAQLRSDAQQLLKLVCGQFFGPAGGFVDMLVQHVPSPVQGAQRQLDKYYTGPLDGKLAQSMLRCDADGPLVVEVTKLYTSAADQAKSFDAFGRILSGTARPDQPVRVLGEAFSLDDDEDATNATISATSLACARYQIPVSGVPAGNLVLLSGIDGSISKTATVVPPEQQLGEAPYIFRPIRHLTESVFKVAVEPVNPSELPKMLAGLRMISKAYPLTTTKVEESGEHIILGTGELYMDCVLHDLRALYADMDIKVSDPVTRFCETVTETSAIMCYALTPNKRNKLTMIAEPLDDGIAADIEAGRVPSVRQAPVREVAKFFEDKYDWDKLAARNIWAFGPDELTGPNVLIDDTLPSTTDRRLLKSAAESIRQGFSWATREGPLCEEPIRNARFRITAADLAAEPIYRGGGQLIPTARRAVYASMLMAAPRLMEPVYSVHVVGPADAVQALYGELPKRRGHVVADGPVAGAPLYAARALLPVIDSFGFETDLRMHSHGAAASVQLCFDHWALVPGDPLDRSVRLRPLDVAAPPQAARDFVLKTRRRKGLADDVDVRRMLEPDLVASLRESGILD